MKYFEYRFEMSDFNPWAIHSLGTTIFGKGQANPFSVSYSNGVVTFRSKADLKINKNVQWSQGFLNKTTPLLSKVEKNVPSSTQLNVEVYLSYGKKVDCSPRCPVWSSGHSEPELKQILSDKGLNLVEIQSASAQSSIMGKKFNLRNLFTLQAKVEVVDSTKWQESFIEGIGQKKSYGFGQMQVVE